MFPSNLPSPPWIHLCSPISLPNSSVVAIQLQRPRCKNQMLVFATIIMSTLGWQFKSIYLMWLFDTSHHYFVWNETSNENMSVTSIIISAILIFLLHHQHNTLYPSKPPLGHHQHNTMCRQGKKRGSSIRAEKKVIGNSVDLMVGFYSLRKIKVLTPMVGFYSLRKAKC